MKNESETVCKSIFSLFLDGALVVVFSSSNMETYLHGTSDAKFLIVTFQKKNMICKTSRILMLSSENFQTFD